MDEIFLCGPGEMIFTVKDWLEQQGRDAQKMHCELCDRVEKGADDLPGKRQGRGEEGSEEEAALKGKTSKVTVKLDGISYDFDLPYDGEPILDAALEQGADLPFACKGGVCCTCRARLIEGKVQMELNYALEQYEITAR